MTAQIVHVLRDAQRVCVRPARPTDGLGIQDFVRRLSAATRWARFFAQIRELAPAALARLTSGGRGSVFVAETRDGCIVALAEYAAGEDAGSCEVALVVADAWQGRGLGYLLMDRLLQSARAAGIERAIVDILCGNDAMLAVARRYDFAAARSPHGSTMRRLVLELRGAALAAA
jgi:acetyltransferase